MARTHKKVRFLPKGKRKHTEASAAKGVEEVLRILEGRWKLVILFHLFGGQVRRFSELRRSIPAVSEKMLIQQLRHMERDGVVRRFVHQQVPPKVEYSLTDWGQALCPALNALLAWVELRPSAERRPSDPFADYRCPLPIGRLRRIRRIDVTSVCHSTVADRARLML